MSIATLKVTLAGASGKIGPAILSSLLGGGFDVTVLARDPSKYSGTKAKIIKPDYADRQRMLSILKGQDVVVSTLGTRAGVEQLALFHATVEAGVKRYIPSEWVSDFTNPIVASFPGPVYGEKTKIRKLAEQAAVEDPNFSYTYIMCGPFLDWGLQMGLFVDIKNEKMERFNGGDVMFSATRCSTVGHAVAAVLKHLDETENRVIKIHDLEMTQNQMLQIGERLKGKKFAVAEVDTAELEKQCWAMSKDPQSEPMAWNFGFIKVASWGGEKYGSSLKPTDNALLGLHEYTGQGAQDLVESEMKKLL